jgi:hypothetical protein
MSHHLLPGMDRAWVHKLTNIFLIRDPQEMLPSLLRVYPEAGLPDTGLPQQAELFDQVREQTGRLPIVIDARDVLTDPRSTLTSVCDALNIPFHDAMLSWPPGSRHTDGIWAKYWYTAVHGSTGFEPYAPKTERLDPRHESLLAQCVPFYEKLHAVRLR